MKFGPARLRRSLFAQLLAVALAAIFAFFIAVVILLQTAATFRLMPFALADVAKPVSEVVFLVESVPPEAGPLVLKVFAGATRTAHLLDEFPGDAARRPGLSARLTAADDDAGAILAGRELRFRYLAPHRWLGRERYEQYASLRSLAALEIAIELEDGRVLAIAFTPGALASSRPTGLGALLLGAAACVGVVAALMIRQALRPLRALEAAAVRFGATIDPTPVSEVVGAEEIRRVARALNRTQERVRSLVAERARMVSAIAHDIRTSMTRLRLRHHEPENIDKPAVAGDFDLMHVLIEDMLTYARSDQSAMHQELVDLGDFVRSYADDAPDDLTLDHAACDDGFVVAADRKAITRALNNLMDNARRYGGAGALSCRQGPAGFEILIDDEGAGIPEDEIESVFEPFRRLEGSRSRETGGSGLGLGIARALIRTQGGEVRLQNRPGGGLRAIIAFPESCRVQ